MKTRILSCLLSAGLAGTFALGLPVALSAQSASSYVASGTAKYNEGDNDGAIADYTKALELNSSYIGAYNGRGLAKTSQGNLDGAVADFTQAIKMKPALADLYLNRGTAEFLQGNLEGAIADNTKAIGLKPDSQAAYFHRALAQECQMAFEGAYADYGKALQLPATNEETASYLALHGALLSKRMGRGKGEQLKAATSWTNEWTKALAGFLQGNVSERDLLKRAATAEGGDKAVQRSQALYFSGVLKVIGGDKTGAKADFQQCQRLSTPSDVVFRMAQAELDRH